MKGKARLVLRGDFQKIGDIPTFLPTPRSITIPGAAAVACAKARTILHFDVEQTFVRSGLEDEVYMRLHSGLGKRSNTVVHARKTLYGLKQAAWKLSGELGIT